MSNRLSFGRDGWIALTLVASTLAVYLPVREHAFVAYDDISQILQNPAVLDGLSGAGIARAFRPYDANWIPLTWISYQINVSLAGLEPAGILLNNVALHAISALLLYVLLVRITHACWRSALVAAVFALHPQHVESVAWATERKDALSGVFAMLTLLCYAHYRGCPGSLRRYLLVVSCLALGLMAKPMLVTLPFVLLLLDYWPLEQLRSSDASSWRRAAEIRARVIEKAPLLGLSVAASAIAFHVQRASGAVSPLDALSLELRVANALESYALYARDFIWPIGLAAFYPYAQAAVAPWKLAAAGLFVVGATVLALRSSVSRPYGVVGWLWYLGMLVPVIGLVQVGMQARADRYMYLPSIGLSIAAAWGAWDLAQRWRVPRSALTALALAALLALAAASRRQVETWQDSESLYRRALAVTDGNYLAHTGLGNARVLLGDLDGAEQHFSEALRIAPGWSQARLGQADVAAARGELAEALRLYEAELARDPSNSSASGRYGIALGIAHRYAEARPHLLRALDAHPGIAELRLSLSIVEAEQGDRSAAVRHAREAARLSPQSGDAANQLAWLLATSRDPSTREPGEAIRTIERIALSTRDPNLLDTLAAAYAAAGRFDAAVETANLAVARAQALGDASGASAFGARLERYRRGEAYFER